jgi:hypothetical protein
MLCVYPKGMYWLFNAGRLMQAGRGISSLPKPADKRL